MREAQVDEIGPSTVTNISVDSTNGVVTLAGQVDSSDAKAKAETVAKAVPQSQRTSQAYAEAPANAGNAARAI